MIFSSPPFFVFFAIYLLFHLVVPTRWRLLLIIAGSTIFYGYWNPWYVWVPYLLMLIAFAGAYWTEQARGTPGHFRRLAVVVCLQLLPLAIIKYTNFVYRDVLGLVLDIGGPPVDWPFPLGISFITFTMISYVVDVYRGHYRLETRPGLLAGLVLFFPHLIAGPILRPKDLVPQLAHPRPARRALDIRIVFGLAIFTVGLLKKLVFADTLADAVNPVFEPGRTDFSAADYLLAWYGFTLQIYCDFSGYTDMAIGVAIVLGVRLPQNFRHPFTAASIVEFWRQWHMTLSSWLRDYIYIPLGGNREGRARQVRNVLITMGLGGLWHGANWTFVLWGFWHGLGIAFVHLVRRAFARRPGRLPRWLKVAVTFHFVCVGFVIFRAPDLATAWRVIAGPFVAPWGEVGTFVSIHAFQLILLVVFLVTHPWDAHRTIRQGVRKLPAAAYWTTVFLIWLFTLAISDPSRKFLYFDF